MTIVPSFDASITSLADAATVKAAFNTAAAAFSGAFTNPVTVNINVGWGEVGGTALAGNQAGASSVAMTSAWSYAQIRSYLPTSDNLPTAQTGPKWFTMAQANARALGLFSATSTANDGSVGFNSGLSYDFNQTDGITAGTYDFVGLAEHEIAEVLGRNTKVNPSGLHFYQTPADLFRYSAPGVQNYSYTTPTYFSLDQGVTNLGWYDNTGGDRSDWLAGSYPGGVQNAYLNTGATSFSPADLRLFRAIGWNGTATSLNRSGSSAGTLSGSSDVPEPAALAILATALAGVALVRRRDPRAKT